MKYINIIAMTILLSACGKKSIEQIPSTVTGGTDGLEPIGVIVSAMTYPLPDRLEFGGELLADLSTSSPVTSSYGTVQKGTTLNTVTILGKEFLVYGEDGVFAAECEADAGFPENGPSNPLCQVFDAESADKIIVCSSSKSSTPIMIAQFWPGVQDAMEDDDLGMQCWVNGVKMLSRKIFTY